MQAIEQKLSLIGLYWQQRPSQQEFGSAWQLLSGGLQSTQKPR
jgi:hypothetical protein